MTGKTIEVDLVEVWISSADLANLVLDTMFLHEILLKLFRRSNEQGTMLVYLDQNGQKHVRQ